ncbi:hypothetical protein [Nonomuraea jabiensis]|uniref:hypothetical protein n=1 Tax=Nonomuraea jabiensis TaxID=882448 RepID=UPI0036AF432E
MRRTAALLGRVLTRAATPALVALVTCGTALPVAAAAPVVDDVRHGGSGGRPRVILMHDPELDDQKP